MRKLITAALTAASVAVLAQSTACAHGSKLTAVNPFPGSSMTWVYGINANNTIVGGYFDSAGIEHGFYGPLNGDYTSFDYGGDSTVTEGRAISDGGEIDGYAPGPGFTQGAEFLFDPATGRITTLTKKGVGTLDGIPQGFNKKGVWVGDYLNPATGLFTGYRGKRGRYAGDIDLGFDTERTSPRAINGDGAVAGWFIDTNGLQHGFLLSNGSAQVIDLDDSGTTVLEGLNNHECIVGQTTDSTGAYHSYILDDTTGQASVINVPGSAYQRAWGISNGGLVALYTDTGSYILGSIKPGGIPGKKSCPSGGEDAKVRIMTASEFVLNQGARGNAHRRVPPMSRRQGALP
jgi:probable HAF family extracellular repeat protein